MYQKELQAVEKRREELRRKLQMKLVIRRPAQCPACGTVFMTKRINHLYCSPACRSAAWLWSKREREERETAGQQQPADLAASLLRTVEQWQQDNPDADAQQIAQAIETLWQEIEQ